MWISYVYLTSNSSYFDYFTGNLLLPAPHLMSAEMRAELSAFLKLVINVLDSPQMEPVSIKALMTKLRDIHYVCL